MQVRNKFEQLGSFCVLELTNRLMAPILWFLGVALMSWTVVRPAGMRGPNLTFTENYFLGV